MVIMSVYGQYIQSYAVKNTLLCIIIPILLDRLLSYRTSCNSLTLRYLVQVTLEEITGWAATFTAAL